MTIRIAEVEVEEKFSCGEDYYLNLHKNMKPLPHRKKPCSDCAVVTGFYKPYSEELKTFSKETQKFVSDRWFCHQTPMCACKGNIDNLNAKEQPC